MDATKMGNSSVNWTAVIEQLTQGRELSARLGVILEEASQTGTSRDLIKEISASFSRALAALDHGVMTENFPGETRKIRYEERGGRNRRTGNNLIRTTVAPTLDDGHSWRKYGQKMISNSEFPRGYYRCIHKHDQKCLATRQVQQSKDHPSLFVITYIGEHTCQVLDSLERNPCVIDFGSSAPTATGSFTPGSSSSHCIATQEMDTLDESESAQFVAELMGGVSVNGDTMPLLHPSSDHDQDRNFVEGLFHEYGYLFGL